MEHARPPILGPRHCEHCSQRVNRWTWRLVEIYPQARYEALCTDCAAKQDASFTEDLAICHAIIIVGVRIGILNQKARSW